MKINFLNVYFYAFTGRIERPTLDSSKVAFYAYLSNTATDLGRNQDIVFDNVVTNVGSGYNGNHGVFVAPVTGTYLFSVTLRGGEDGKTWIHVVVNGLVVAKIDLQNSLYLQNSQTIVVNLNEGDDVSVQNTIVGGAITGDRCSTLSGFLIYPSADATEVVG